MIIPHYDDPRYDTVMEPGMTFTIEPMLNLGTHEWDMWEDDWTVVTRDRVPRRSSSTRSWSRPRAPRSSPFLDPWTRLKSERGSR